MAGNADQFVADLVFFRERSLEHQMFFVLQDLLSVGKFREDDPLTGRRIGGHRLVTQVERNAVGSRSADDAGQQDRSWRKFQIGKHIAVVGVTEDTGSRREFDRRIVVGRIDGERTRSTTDHRRNRKPFLKESISKLADFLKLLLDGGFAVLERTLVLMAIVDVKAGGVQTRELSDETIQFRSAIAHRQSGTVLAAIEIEQDIDLETGSRHDFRKLTDRVFVVGSDRKRDVGILPAERHCPPQIGTHQIVGEENILRTGFSQHLSLGERGGLVIADSFLEFELDDFGHLVCFTVRTQPADITGDRDHVIEIVLEIFAKDDHRRGQQFRGVLDLVCWVFHSMIPLSHGDLVQTAIVRGDGTKHNRGMMKNFVPQADPRARSVQNCCLIVSMFSVLLLAGCPGGDESAAKSTRPMGSDTNSLTQNSNAPSNNEEKNVGGFVLDKEQFQEDVRQDPEPQTIHRPVLPDPVQSDELLKQYGYARYSSKHLLLITDIEPEIARQLVQSADQEYAAWEKYFGPLPPAADGSAFRMVGYLMRDMQPMIELGLVPNKYLGMRTGGHLQSHFWMLDQETDYYRRHLLFHEATHCYMTIMPDTSLPKWYLEGMAELFGTHRQDENGTFVFRVMPEDKQHFAGWGRIKVIQEEVAAGRMKSIGQIRSIERIDPVDEVRDYAWSWALCYFLDAHPHYQERFRSLQAHWRSNLFRPQFDRLFEADLERMQLEWRLFANSIVEGYDVPRAAIEFAETQQPVTGEQQVTIAAGRGWQGTGWQVEAGKTYEINASGEVSLDDQPQPWISEPQGITLRYADGIPLGRLTGLLVESKAFEGLRKIDLGRRSSWTAPNTGTLYLRVNDNWNDLHNNEGSYRVTIQP